ncbi:hypothetical protein HaLaN_32561, partial [Haematococcus lacustris]
LDSFLARCQVWALLYFVPRQSRCGRCWRSTEGAPTATRLAATLGPSSRDV